MGTVFIFWDKLFGTFQQELPPQQYQPIRYGITHALENDSIPTLIFHEWSAIMRDMRRKDISFKQKLMYALWSPALESRWPAYDEQRDAPAGNIKKSSGESLTKQDTFT